MKPVTESSPREFLVMRTLDFPGAIAHARTSPSQPLCRNPFAWSWSWIPISDIKPAKDTTLAMLLAAQERGWELWYAEQKRPVAAGRRRPWRGSRRCR